MFKYSQIIYFLHKKLTNVGLEVSTVYVISSPYVSNCFEFFVRYILENLSQNKIRQENYIMSLYITFNCVKMARYSQSFSNYIKRLQQNVLILRYCIH